MLVLIREAFRLFLILLYMARIFSAFIILRIPSAVLWFLFLLFHRLIRWEVGSPLNSDSVSSSCLALANSSIQVLLEFDAFSLKDLYLWCASLFFCWIFSAFHVFRVDKDSWICACFLYFSSRRCLFLLPDLISNRYAQKVLSAVSWENCLENGIAPVCSFLHFCQLIECLVV